jgi:hypothetical protein
MFNPLTNISVNLKAMGPAAVMIAWMTAVVAVALFGQGELAGRALVLLGFAGGAILMGLAGRA